MRISIIIPTLNEAQGLPSLLAQLKKLSEGTPTEIIVADGGSTDGTAGTADAKRGQWSVDAVTSGGQPVARLDRVDTGGPVAARL